MRKRKVQRWLWIVDVGRLMSEIAVSCGLRVAVERLAID